MHPDPIEWPAQVASIFFDDPVEFKALELSLALARWHYETDPPDTTSGSLYYMTLAGWKRTADKVISYSLINVEQDHLFFGKIVWR